MKRCFFVCVKKKDSLVVYGIVSRTALAARLGAVDRQLGREHLLVAVLGDLSTGLVHHPRAALVRARAGGCTTTLLDLPGSSTAFKSA